MMADTAKQVMTALVERALTQRHSGRSFPFPASDEPLRGRPVPEHFMPGRLVMGLDAATREVLATLRSDDLRHHRPIPWA